MTNRSRRARGIALVGVLWVLALLSLAAAAAAASLRSEARMTGHLREAARAYSAAEGGVQFGMFALVTDRGDGRWAADGTVHELTLEGAVVRFTILDESGKLDLNHAPESALRRLLSSGGALPADVERIVAGIASARQEKPFAAVDDLMGVSGVSAELYRAVRPALTVYARQPGVMAEAASRQVLLAVPGTDAAGVDRYLAEKDRSRAERPRAAAGAFVRNGSATFRVHAQARLPSGATAHAAAVVDVRRPRRHAPFLVLDWRREGPELFP